MMMRHIPQPSSWNFKFYSGSGTGNTFLIADMFHRFKGFSLSDIKAPLIDALKLHSKDSGLVFEQLASDLYKMMVIEKDGSESSFCGNGARVFAHYLYTVKNIPLARLEIENKIILLGKNEWPISSDEESFFVECGMPNYLGLYQFDDISFGNFIVCGEPHLITNDFFDIERLIDVARRIREFQSINVSCIKKNSILTYERGVEDVTQSCGSACIAATHFSQINKLIDLKKKITEWNCLGGTNWIETGKFSLIGHSFLDERELIIGNNNIKIT